MYCMNGRLTLADEWGFDATDQSCTNAKAMNRA